MTDRQELFDIITARAEALRLAGKDIPFYRYEERRKVCDAVRDEAIEVLSAAGATVRDGGSQGVVLRAGGLQSSSTSGLHGAITNWLAQARQKWGLS